MTPDRTYSRPPRKASEVIAPAVAVIAVVISTVVLLGVVVFGTSAAVVLWSQDRWSCVDQSYERVAVHEGRVAFPWQTCDRSD
jgi:hypothetical protein